MAVLTIKANDVGGLAALNRLVALQETSVKTTEKLAGIAGTLKTHFFAAGDAVRMMNAQLATARAESERLASNAKAISAGFLGSAGVARTFAAEVAKAGAEAAKTARIANSIRMPRAGGSGTFTGPGSASTPFSFSPVPRSSPGASAAGAVGSGIGALGRGFGGGFSAFGGATASALGGLASAGSSVVSSAGGGAGMGALLGPLGAAAGVTVGTLSSGVEAAFKAGIGILQTGVRTAVGILDTGVKGAAAVGGALLADSLRRATSAEPIAKGFGDKTQAKGLGEQTAVLKELRVAARGTVSDLELMRGANYALSLGAASTTKELGLLIEAGRRLGKTVGRDAKDGFNDLALGIGRAQPEILDNLGITMKAQEAQESFAKSIGKTAAELTASESKLAFTAAAYAAVRKALSEQSTETLTAADRLAQLRTTYANVSATIGSTFLPVLGRAAGNWSKFLDDLGPSRIRAAIGDGFDWIGKKLGGISDAVMGKDFTGATKGLFGGLKEAIVNPSREAFEILGLRGEQWINSLRASFKGLWADFGAWAKEALADVLIWMKDKATNSLLRMAPGGLGDLAVKGKDALPSPASSLIRWGIAGGSGEEAAKAREQARAEAAAQNAALEKRIAGLQSSRLAGIAGNVGIGSALAALGMGQGAAPRQTLGAAPMAGSTTPANPWQPWTPRVSTLDGGLQAFGVKAATRAYGESRSDELQGRAADVRSHLAELEGLQNDLIGSFGGLFDATQNAKAALAGLPDPGKTTADVLVELSGKLRDFPNALEEASKAVQKAEAERLAVLKRHTDEEARLRADFNRGLQKTVSEFLQSGPQDYESVRVRSMKRKAQKERARFNADLVNQAVGSASFDNLGGDFGGFGTQGTERTPTVFGKRFQGLEGALARQVDTGGGTLLAEVQARVAEITAKQLDELEKLNVAVIEAEAKKAAIEEKQNAAIAATNDALAAGTALQAQMLARIEQTTAASVATQAQIAKIQADLERIGRLAKK